jgi:hypothetical protein
VVNLAHLALVVRVDHEVNQDLQDLQDHQAPVDHVENLAPLDNPDHQAHQDQEVSLDLLDHLDHLDHPEQEVIEEKQDPWDLPVLLVHSDPLDLLDPMEERAQEASQGGMDKQVQYSLYMYHNVITFNNHHFNNDIVSCDDQPYSSYEGACS